MLKRHGSYRWRLAAFTAERITCRAPLPSVGAEAEALHLEADIRADAAAKVQAFI